MDGASQSGGGEGGAAYRARGAGGGDGSGDGGDGRGKADAAPLGSDSPDLFVLGMSDGVVEVGVGELARRRRRGSGRTDTGEEASDSSGDRAEVAGGERAAMGGVDEEEEYRCGVGRGRQTKEWSDLSCLPSWCPGCELRLRGKGAVGRVTRNYVQKGESAAAAARHTFL